MFLTLKDFLRISLNRLELSRDMLLPRCKIFVDALLADVFHQSCYAELRYPFGRKKGEPVVPSSETDVDYGYVMGLASWRLSPKQMVDQKDLWYVIHVLACHGYMKQYKDRVPGYTFPVDKLLACSSESSTPKDVLKFQDRVYSMIEQHSKGAYSFGKYKGVSRERVYLEDPRYTGWVIENVDQLPQEDTAVILAMHYGNSIFGG